MNKDDCSRERVSGNNTLSAVIVRVDFLTLELDKIVERFLECLGDRYVYNQINSYSINIDILDPKKLVTQDFIKQKVDLNNNYEFKSVDDGLRFIINQNFLLYERKNFVRYKGSQKDKEVYFKLLKILFDFQPKVQRLGVRKSNTLFIEQDIQKLKQVLDNEFIKSLDDNDNQKVDLTYTPMEENQKDGYNLKIQLDYGKIKINDKNKDVYRAVIDIDSYIRDTERIDEYNKIVDNIEKLDLSNFEIYKSQMSEKFLDVIVENNEEEFNKKMNNLGVLLGGNYGNH